LKVTVFSQMLVNLHSYKTAVNATPNGGLLSDPLQDLLTTSAHLFQMRHFNNPINLVTVNLGNLDFRNSACVHACMRAWVGGRCRGLEERHLSNV